MDITRRCDYACRILRAAYHHGDTYMSVADIAEAEDIPYAFARSIQHDLVKAALIKTARGARGGLVLSCDLAQVTLLDVLESIQGPVTVSLCALDPDYCEKQEGCAYNKVWQGADRLLNGYFASITLKDLFEQGGMHPAVAAAMTTSDAPTACVDVAVRSSTAHRQESCACAADAACCTRIPRT